MDQILNLYINKIIIIIIIIIEEEAVLFVCFCISKALLKKIKIF